MKHSFRALRCLPGAVDGGTVQEVHHMFHAVSGVHDNCFRDSVDLLHRSLSRNRYVLHREGGESAQDRALHEIQRLSHRSPPRDFCGTTSVREALSKGRQELGHTEDG